MTNQKPEIPIPTLDMHKEFVRRSKECKSIEEMLAKDTNSAQLECFKDYLLSRRWFKFNLYRW